jgi:uncharacterized membrane protein YdbT with pleckstrin-like domain
MSNQPKIYKPSQWLNLGYLILGIALTYFFWWAIVIPIWKILETYCTEYIIYEDRIIYKRGVFRILTDEVLFYRVKGLSLDEPLLFRVVGISIIRIKTSDQYVQELALNGIYAKQPFFMELRRVIEKQRKNNGVREFDVFHL